MIDDTVQALDQGTFDWAAWRASLQGLLTDLTPQERGMLTREGTIGG